MRKLTTREKDQIYTSLSNSLLTIRHEYRLSNKELFTAVCVVIPSFMLVEYDKRTTVAREQTDAIKTLNEAFELCIKHMH